MTLPCALFHGGVPLHRTKGWIGVNGRLHGLGGWPKAPGASIRGMTKRLNAALKVGSPHLRDLVAWPPTKTHAYFLGGLQSCPKDGGHVSESFAQWVGANGGSFILGAFFCGSQVAATSLPSGMGSHPPAIGDRLGEGQPHAASITNIHDAVHVV